MSRIRATSLLWLIIGLSWLLVAPHGELDAQQTVDDASWRRGYNGLALICRSLGMEVQTSERTWRQGSASESVLVALGDIRNLPVDPETFVTRGGALLLASDRTGNFDGGAIRFAAGPRRVVRDSDCFAGRYMECPIVRPRRSNHPVVQGVQQIVTNRSGGLRVRSQSGQLASMPPLQGTSERYEFLVAREGRRNSRMLACADQSVFSNQMLIHGDNARFALQAMAWLAEGGRTNLLIVVDGRVKAPADPRGVDVQLPPPSRAEVLEALKNLPPDKLLEFGNTVAAVVEEENLVNEFLATIVEELDDRVVMRTLIFLATIILGLWLFLKYAGSESMLQEVADPWVRADRLKEAVSAKSRFADDRKLAALQLVQKFYFVASDGTRRDVRNFPDGITVDAAVADRVSILRDLKKAGRHLRNPGSGWWTTERLRWLQSSVEQWNHLHDNHLLVYDANNASASSNPSLAASPQSI